MEMGCRQDGSELSIILARRREWKNVYAWHSECHEIQEGS
jgi:hypothetical protein